nr:hypothetical protein [uncultured Flavobacterium sp.]
MNIIENIAKEFIIENFAGSENKIYFLNELEKELARHRKETDKIMFLSAVKFFIQEEYNEHYENCKQREDCDLLKWHLKAILYVNNILEDYSISSNKEDIFSNSEKEEYSKKLDKILEEIEVLKKGHEIIYDGISEEIEALKNQFYLGKKSWKQIIVGKAIEMAIGGVVSETISKDLINMSGIAAQKLLE